MNKFKKWLVTSDEEGLTGWDAIFAFCWHLFAWGLVIIGGLYCR